MTCSICNSRPDTVIGARRTWEPVFVCEECAEELNKPDPRDLELAALREHVKVLREALEGLSDGPCGCGFDDCKWCRARAALAKTEK